MNAQISSISLAACLLSASFSPATVFSEENNALPVSVSLSDGSTLKGEMPASATIELDTLVGRVSIPFDKISSLSVSDTAARKTTDACLVYHCTFDSIESIIHPEVGPAGHYAGGMFTAGRKGQSLLSYADQPSAEVSFPPGVLGPRGTIEFWAKLEGSPFAVRPAGGGIPRFFGLWLYQSEDNPGLCSTHLQFTTNDGMGSSGLCGMVYDCCASTESSIGTDPYLLLRGDFNGWHHYAMSWDPDGIPDESTSGGKRVVIALYLDGECLQSVGRKFFPQGKKLVEIPSLQGTLAFPTPTTGWNSSAAHFAFRIDEFKIWNRALSGFDLVRE